MLIFFDDILIYNFSKEEHISHVKKVLFALSKPEFYVHKDKSVFDEDLSIWGTGFLQMVWLQVLDLGKIQAIQPRLVPKNIKD